MRLPRTVTRQPPSARWPVSPAVVVTFIAHYEADTPGQHLSSSSQPPAGPVTLDLLVFWRGSPAWFTKGDHSTGSGGGDDKGHVNERVELGGLVLEVSLDKQKGVARVAGQEIALGNANVILVDGVDLPGGPKVVGTRSVDPMTDPLPDGLYTVLRGAPDLVPFMHCEARLPEAGGFMRQVFAASCARMVKQ